VKAVVYDRYGGPDELRVVDLPLPSPAAGQVRLKVAATSVNLSDWECLRGSPAYARIGGPRSRMRRTLGSDIAGVVDEVGEGVVELRVGDHVYGDSLVMKGGFAEYAVVPQAALARKPAELTFAESSTSAGRTSPRRPRPTTSSWTWSPTAQCSLTGVHCRQAERTAVWAGRRAQCCGSSPSAWWLADSPLGRSACWQ
jgi:NADPH:quinone reductase-like Zn-dependent oxidoreductase